MGWADLTRPADGPRLRFLRPVVSERVGGSWHEATAELAFFETPREELADLRLRAVRRASAGWLGITITGAVDA